jgi:hypothetical protein
VPENPLSKHLQIFIRRYGKLIQRVSDSHPTSFNVLLLPTLEFCYQHALTNYARNEQNEVLLVNCLTFITKTIERPDASQEGSHVSIVLEQFFTPERLTDMGQTLVMKYFLMTEMDLAEWQAQPELFISDEMIDTSTGGKRVRHRYLTTPILQTNALSMLISSIFLPFLGTTVDRCQLVHDDDDEASGRFRTLSPPSSSKLSTNGPTSHIWPNTPQGCHLRNSRTLPLPAV